MVNSVMNEWEVLIFFKKEQIKKWIPGWIYLILNSLSVLRNWKLHLQISIYYLLYLTLVQLIEWCDVRFQLFIHA